MNSLLDQFREYIKTHQLMEDGAQLLITVSGGVDSVVLLDLLTKAGYGGIVAHCNFHLRGAESDADESFVRHLAHEYGLPFIVHHFDTRAYAKGKGYSMEMAARELRYQWFYQEAEAHDLSSIATGHHLDDQIETFLLNLIRGTGLKGLTGMQPLSRNIARPLLFASRQEILDYANKQQLPFREDSTNRSVEIMRNRIRHRIVPELAAMKSGFYKRMEENLQQLAAGYQLLNQHVQDVFAAIKQQDGPLIFLPIEALKALSPLHAYLYEFLSPYHFHGDVLRQLARSLDQQSGRQFFSPAYRIVKDRKKLVISPLPKAQPPLWWDMKHSVTLTDPFGQKWLMEAVPREKSDTQKTLPAHEALLNADKLATEVCIRHWKPGDRFYPAGLGGSKKLKAFFTDQKLSIAEKERIWLLESEGEIAWVAGFRVDERFKALPGDTRVLKISIHRKPDDTWTPAATDFPSL